jgi:HTH-type transcriptional regulator / antitoxin HigA
LDTLTLSPAEARELAEHFSAVVSKVPLREIRDEAGYDAAVRSLHALLDAGGADEEHQLAPLVAALGRFIGDYDDRHYSRSLDSAH